MSSVGNPLAFLVVIFIVVVEISLARIRIELDEFARLNCSVEGNSSRTNLDRRVLCGSVNYLNGAKVVYLSACDSTCNADFYRRNAGEADTVTVRCSVKAPALRCLREGEGVVCIIGVNENELPPALEVRRDEVVVTSVRTGVLKRYKNTAVL